MGAPSWCDGDEGCPGEQREGVLHHGKSIEIYGITMVSSGENRFQGKIWEIHSWGFPQIYSAVVCSGERYRRYVRNIYLMRMVIDGSCLLMLVDHG